MILRTIHVGVGGYGQWTVDVLGKDPRFKPVAIVDNASTAAKVAQYRFAEYGHKNVPIFSGLTGALSQMEADALVIATPTRTHAEFARMGFTVGMHVLVEKGMTTDYAMAQQLVAEADAAWSKFVVAQNYRYSPAEQTISHILKTPAHPCFPGDIKMVDYIHHRYKPLAGDHDYSYAMVWDTSSHHVDSLANWLGPAKRVTARSYIAPWSAAVHESNITAFVEYESGAVCNYVLTHDTTLREWRIVLQGDRGALVLTDHAKLRFYPKPHHEVADAEPQAVECEIIDCPTPEQCIVADFFRYVVEDVEPGISGKKNLETMRMCEALVRSAKNKRPVELAELK